MLLKILFLLIPYSSAFTPDEAKIISFKNDFQKLTVAANGKSITEQTQLWNRLIEEPHQKFYDFAVWEKPIRPNWSDLKKRVLPSRLQAYQNNADKMIKAFEDFPKIVQEQIATIKKIVPGFELNFPIYAVLAPNFDAKSVMTGADSNSVALAIAIDSVVLQNASYEILFPHELFHAFHARHRGFLNDGVMPATTIIVPLWEEGLATYVSALANKNRSDTDLLFDKSFANLTNIDVQWLAKKFLTDIKQKTLNPTPSVIFKKWFSMGDLKIRDDLPNRCGYFLGLRVVREIAKNHSLKEIINWKPSEIERPILKALANLKK